MKITALVENTLPEATEEVISANEPLRASELAVEHGLSLYIETKYHKILFDMGQSDLFARNAEALGVDLKSVDMAVLSHGHYDHGGGLKTFLEHNRKAPVYVNKWAFEPHYHGEQRYIGLDRSLEETFKNTRLIYTEDETVIGEGLTLYSCNGRDKKYHLGSCGLQMIQKGMKVPDDFRHEQYLLIEEDGKRVLISGCSHKGILDIVSWFEPYVLIGGFHFSTLPLDEKLEEYGKILADHKTQYVTCHCTGKPQFTYMKQFMKKQQLSYLACGQSICIS